MPAPRLIIDGGQSSHLTFSHDGGQSSHLTFSDGGQVMTGHDGGQS